MSVVYGQLPAMSQPQNKPKVTLLTATILRIFSDQQGVASRAQLLAGGLGRSSIARATKRKLIVPMYPGVYRWGSTPASSEQRLVAACLAVEGAVVSHRAAAWLHGFAGFENLTVEVSTKAGTEARGVLAHRVTDLPEADLTRVRGIRVTREARTLLDLSEVAPGKLVARALDDALRRRLVRHAQLTELLEARSPRRKGTRIIRELLRERAPEDERAASELESRFLRLLRRHKLPRPRVNVDVRDERGHFIARPDFLYEVEQVAIFLDGLAYHSNRQEFEKDRRQGNELVRRGWTVLRYTWARVERDEAAVVAELRAVLTRSAKGSLREPTPDLVAGTP